MGCEACGAWSLRIDGYGGVVTSSCHDLAILRKLARVQYASELLPTWRFDPLLRAWADPSSTLVVGGMGDMLLGKTRAVPPVH
eukprot:6480034-Amphidinium_carterae.1